jgi:hypothetical protein
VAFSKSRRGIQTNVIIGRVLGGQVICGGCRTPFPQAAMTCSRAGGNTRWRCSRGRQATPPWASTATLYSGSAPASSTMTAGAGSSARRACNTSSPPSAQSSKTRSGTRRPVCSSSSPPVLTSATRVTPGWAVSRSWSSARTSGSPSAISTSSRGGSVTAWIERFSMSLF